jgi:hypothetical protein
MKMKITKSLLALALGIIVLFSPFVSFATQGPSSTSISCNPSTITTLQSTICSVTVVGTSPTGTISFQSSNGGSFNPTTCTLSSGTCSVSFTPFQTGNIQLTASYPGDVNNYGSYGTFIITVSSTAQQPTSYFDGFEQYPSGTECFAYPNGCTLPTNNLGWNFAQLSTGCSTNLFGFILGSSTGFPVYAGNQAAQVEYPSSCHSGDYGVLYLNVTAISNTVVFSAYHEEANTTATYSCINIQRMGTILATSCNPGFKSSSSWALATANFGATVGAQYLVILDCYIAVTISSSGGAYCSYDNALVQGAVLTNKPINFKMVDYVSKPNLYNIQGYDSIATSININYTQNKPSLSFANVSTSDLNLPFKSSNTSLITVYLNNHYCGGSTCYRTLIPTSAANNTMYLDNPAFWNAYQITLQDVTATFLPGSIVEIQSGGYNISTGYLDSAYTYSVDLTPGPYTFIVKYGSASFAELINFGANSQVTVQNSANPTSGINPGAISTVTYSTYWACNSNTQIIANYKDTSSSTNPLNIILYNTTSAGTFLITNTTINGPLGTAQTTFNVKANNGTYTVAFQPTLSTGKQFYGPIQLTPTNPSCPSTFPGLIPNLPNFPVSIFGLNALIPGGNAYTEIIGLVLIIFTIAVFGARQAQIGFIVVSFEALFLFLALFIPGVWILLYAFVLASFIGYLVSRRRRFVRRDVVSN